MKNLLSQRQKLSFNIFRALAICALFCTVGLAIFLCAESFVPRDKSAEQSQAIEGAIKDRVNVIENTHVPLEAIECKGSSISSYYIGDSEDLYSRVNFFPSNATDKSLTFESTHPDLWSVDENGILTCLDYGEANIIITSVENPQISVSVPVFCGGKKPVKDEVTDFTLYKLVDKEVYPLEEVGLTVCESPTLQYRDQNNKIIGAASIQLTSSDSSIIAIQGKYLCGIREGEATITAKCKYADITKQFQVKVTNPKGLTAPTEFEFEQNIVNISLFETYNALKNVTNTKYSSNMCEIKVGDTKIAAASSYTLMPRSVGLTTVTLTPFANPTESFTYTINIYEPVPKSIKISGQMRILAGESHRYTIPYTELGNGNLSQIKWEVKGNNATISPTGVLIANKLGKVTIRATSLQNPEIYDEITIKVSLFSNFSSFVRKVIGHFTGFAVLGLGFAVCYFLLMRPRWSYAPCALISGFLVATLSEVFQLPIFVSGRGASWVDVMIDTLGVATGIAVASLIIFIYLIVIKVSKKQSSKVRRTLATLKPKTLFLSPTKTAILMDMQEYEQEKNCSTSNE